MPTSVLSSSERSTSRLCVLLFCAALAAHFYFVTINWTYEFMAGHEFRQPQTALISYFIDKENDFSIDYYFYACAAFLLVTLGAVLHGVLDSRLPRWLSWAFVAVSIVFMASTYLGGY